MSEQSSNEFLFEQLSVEELGIEEFEVCLETSVMTTDSKNVSGGQMAW